jgi:hypothetical protein
MSHHCCVVAIGAFYSHRPKVNDFPVMYEYDPKKFLCAVKYYGDGHEMADFGCNKCHSDPHNNGYLIRDGYENSAHEGSHYSFGSAIVRPGCKLYLFEVI